MCTNFPHRMDLFKDNDSSSSDENDQGQVAQDGMGGGNAKDDFMAFNTTAKIIPLSNRYRQF